MPAKSRGVSKTQRNREAPLARRIVAAARVNPDHRCWRCGNTLATCGPHGNGTNRNGTPATWHAGHRDGRLYAAECSPCNERDGAIEGNRKREPSSGWLTL